MSILLASTGTPFRSLPVLRRKCPSDSRGDRRGPGSFFQGKRVVDVVSEGVKRVDRPQPTFDELLIALKSFDKPADASLGKHVSTIVVGAAMAIGIWVVSSLSTVQNTMAKVQVTVETTAKSTEEVKRDIRSISDQQSNMKAELAEIRQRVDALEKRVSS